MRRIVASLIFALLQSPAIAADCQRTKGLAVDADGAPESYRVDGKGLSYTCDGVFAIVGGVPQTHKNNPANWQTLCASHWKAARASGDYSKLKIVGFMTDAKNRPIIQGAGDPHPGEAFITTTSMTIPGTPDKTQRRYVDATQIPYIVAPSGYVKANKLGDGGLVAVYRPGSGAIAFAVVADCCSLGEGSIKLHRDLGNDPIVVKSDGTRRAKRGIADAVVFMPLRGTSTNRTTDAQAWQAEIRQKGTEALTALGGLPALKACAGKLGL